MSGELTIEVEYMKQDDIKQAFKELSEVEIIEQRKPK